MRAFLGKAARNKQNLHPLKAASAKCIVGKISSCTSVCIHARGAISNEEEEEEEEEEFIQATTPWSHDQGQRPGHCSSRSCSLCNSRAQRRLIASQGPSAGCQRGAIIFAAFSCHATRHVTSVRRRGCFWVSRACRAHPGAHYRHMGARPKHPGVRPKTPGRMP